jgi:hypothetical protein
VLLVCAVLLVAAMTAGVAVGSVGLAPLTVWRVVFDHLAGHPQSSTADAIVQRRQPSFASPGTNALCRQGASRL